MRFPRIREYVVVLCSEMQKSGGQRSVEGKPEAMIARYKNPDNDSQRSVVVQR